MINVNRRAILFSMNMTLSKRGDYVVRSALALALAYPSGAPRKIREVVAEMGVPQTFASQILADLVRAGLASSKAGKDGGYRLARPPEEITLLEVVEAGEGPLRADRCALGDGPCRWESVCPLHETWRSAIEALRAVLRDTSLADLARRDLEIEEGRVVAPSDSHRRPGRSVAVSDFVQIELGAEELCDRLADDRVTATAVEAALEEVESLRRGLNLPGPHWWPAAVAATLLPTRAPAADHSGGASTITSLALAFEAEATKGPVCKGEFICKVTHLDQARCELSAEGRIALAADLAPGDPQLERLSQVMLRTLLRRLASLAEADRTPRLLGELAHRAVRG